MNIKFPTFLRNINKFTSKMSGILFLCIAFLIVFEVIMRYAFRNPVGWTIDYACYTNLYALFFATAYAFMSKEHVNVDLVLGWADKRTRSPRRKPRRTMQIINYFLVLIFIGVILYGSIESTITAVDFKSLSYGTYPIPTVWLHGFMIAACVLMIISVIFILLDLFTSSEEFV